MAIQERSEFVRVAPETNTAIPVLEYRAAEQSKPLLSRVYWKRFWQGLLLSVSYGSVGTIVWALDDEIYRICAIRHGISKEILAWALATILVLLVADIQRRTASWSFVGDRSPACSWYHLSCIYYSSQR